MRNTVGDKIRAFRKREKLSQLALELEINASPGSVSRIENGQVNPTKETLKKISEVLKLTTHEISVLFDLSTDELPDIINLANKISGSLDLDKVLQNSVNEVVFDLGLNGSVLFLIEGDVLRTKTVTESFETDLMMKILKLVRFELQISLKKETDNLVVKCVREQKTFLSDDLKDFTRDVINGRITDLCAKVTEHVSGIVYPLIHNGESIGAIFFSQSYKEDFKKDMLVLESFVEHITTAIVNAQSYSKLREEVNYNKYGGQSN
jgi:transcriptional regulator with XRE-family HTH domain